MFELCKKKLCKHNISNYIFSLHPVTSHLAGCFRKLLLYTCVPSNVSCLRGMLLDSGCTTDSIGLGFFQGQMESYASSSLQILGLLI